MGGGRRQTERETSRRSEGVTESGSSVPLVREDSPVLCFCVFVGVLSGVPVQSSVPPVREVSPLSKLSVLESPKLSLLEFKSVLESPSPVPQGVRASVHVCG